MIKNNRSQDWIFYGLDLTSFLDSPSPFPSSPVILGRKSQAFGLSETLGAFVGGVLVAETDYKHQIEAVERSAGDGWMDSA